MERDCPAGDEVRQGQTARASATQEREGGVEERLQLSSFHPSHLLPLAPLAKSSGRPYAKSEGHLLELREIKIGTRGRRSGANGKQPVCFDQEMGANLRRQYLGL